MPTSPTSRDLSSAAQHTSALLERVDVQQLTAPTPCTEFSVRDLLDHLLELTLAFRHAATKTEIAGGEAPREGGAEPDSWRTRLPAQLDALAAAWREPAAWDGTTEVGGISLPGAMAGGFALNELVLHGWDLAKASTQPFSCDPSVVEAALHFTTDVVNAGFGGAYGPPVTVPDDAPALDRLLGLAGRDPSWTAPAIPGRAAQILGQSR
ncbi:TIGR03086 family metal-binding protein [Pseudonocardia sp. H11422]|uniref:TIGR03086 family metal-binding protein n=1 Tax=Pseudonocardia sp. H11422 TaxID=2835866 RepID=UPI001BDD1628|nr:TIGR03086 family metal-binding protein [Pseudonocardia sp. H11422]